MRRRPRTSDLGSSRAVQGLGLVRKRLPEERRCFRGILVLFFFRWRQRQERNERFQRRERHQERRQAQVRLLAEKTQERLVIGRSGHRATKNRTDFLMTRSPDYPIPPFRSGMPTTKVRLRGSSSSAISPTNCSPRPSRSHS